MTEAPVLDALYALRDQRQIEEDQEQLPLSLSAFARAAWPTLKPDERFMHNWHLDAISAHLEAVSRGEITRLQIWIPPGTMKTGLVTVFLHCWEWMRRPGLRYWTASYETRLIGRFSAMARTVMMSPWYQDRWGEMFRFTRESEHYYENDHGGSRLATSPTSTGTGEHGHRILIDDPVTARAADPAFSGRLGSDLRTMLRETNEWYDSTVSTRGIDGSEFGPHAEVLVMQRLHENDLAGHILESEEWTVLCLPERFEEGHPYAWRGEFVHSALRLPDELREGDPRVEGELLWPQKRDEIASEALAVKLTRHRAAGQLQQRPSAREGEILKRDWWRFYDPRDPYKLPRFGRIIVSVDTPLKDKETNDYVAIQVWGVSGANRYLLDLDKAHLNYGKCKRRVIEMARWARQRWPSCPHQLLIENAGYGVELIMDLKQEVTGVTKISPGLEGDKIARAEAASDALESGNCYLPGYGPPWQPAYDEKHCSAEVADFVHSCALFPNGSHDDDVDAWSQAMNWLRGRNATPLRTSRFRRR